MRRRIAAIGDFEAHDLHAGARRRRRHPGVDLQSGRGQLHGNLVRVGAGKRHHDLDFGAIRKNIGRRFPHGCSGGHGQELEKTPVLALRLVEQGAGFWPTSRIFCGCHSWSMNAAAAGEVQGLGSGAGRTGVRRRRRPAAPAICCRNPPCSSRRRTSAGIRDTNGGRAKCASCRTAAPFPARAAW